MLLLGVATATSNATANTPRMLVQFGPSRTATTLQFQSICAAAVLLSRRGDQPPEDQAVDCFFTNYEFDEGDDQWSTPQDKAKIFTKEGVRGRVVLKIDDDEVLEKWITKGTADGGAWLFATSAQGAANAPTKVNGVDVHYTQALPELVEKGLEYQASRYAELFALNETEAKELTEYLGHWDKLRVCCGTQMSASYRAFLHKSDEHHRMKGGVSSDTSAMCQSLNLDQEESAMMATSLFQYGKHVRVVSHPTMWEEAFTGTYCTRANVVIAEHKLKFNARLQKYRGNKD